ncbi:glycosyltransferase involved in cell wall biosynthesis [Aliiruegeria haliotis]|uniref:Glycosyltransferase involved in cell wall biosynthesis n=1 Tax=Aliiruegeria haliotis TaxID=1280846 RepID=A0A2T0RVH1_9RHOB|nr:glycosyltransferase [Aliiruegeria haliotis]PRY25199.1 glycosyltransferase involved in cell wall biosynthesis [Aliiruegeria haliotis]
MTAHVLYIGGEDADLRLPFIKAVRALGYRVSVAASGGEAAFVQEGIDFVPFAFDRFISPLSDRRATRRLGEILDKVQPDLAQGFDTKPCLMLPIAASGRDTLAVRTICGRGWVYSSRSPLAMSVRLVLKGLHGVVASRYADATVFQNSSDRDFFEQQGMAGRNAVVIPAGGGGIDPARFDAALEGAPSPETLRDELGLGTDEVVITVSRLTRQKGIETLLKAAEIVLKDRPGVRFLLVGPRESEGRDAISAAKITAMGPSVVATGPRTDIPALLRMADLFAFPTEYAEGVPRVLLEAALAGLPIVSTSMPGCLEVIEDQKTGRLVPPQSPELLAQAILSALSDKEKGKAMAARLPDRVRQRFTVESGAASHDVLYRKLLAGQTVEDPTGSQWTAADTGPA